MGLFNFCESSINTDILLILSNNHEILSSGFYYALTECEIILKIIQVQYNEKKDKQYKPCSILEVNKSFCKFYSEYHFQDQSTWSLLRYAFITNGSHSSPRSAKKKLSSKVRKLFFKNNLSTLKKECPIQKLVNDFSCFLAQVPSFIRKFN